MSYFEGQTIKIPRIQDLKDIVNALLFYEKKINSSLTDEEILNELNIPKCESEKINSTLNLISEIVKEYDFKREKLYD